MDKPFLGRLRRISNAEMIMVMVGILIVWVGYLTADIQYNRSLSITNQQNLAIQNGEIQNQTDQLKHIIEAQGNLSAGTRNQLMQQFTHASEHGGFATNDTQQNITNIISGLDYKLDKLLNSTTTAVNR